MIRTQAIRDCALALATLALMSGIGARSQTSSPGESIHEKLVKAGLIDPYYSEVALEIGKSLRQAADDRWPGVQVDGPYRPGWVNIYMVDASRLRDPALLQPEGVNFTKEALEGGALSDAKTGIVFVNSAFWKRLTAATYLTQVKAQSDITAALAQVDAIGLAAAKPAWDPATLLADKPETNGTGQLMQGAFAFVLAHEMGHLRNGQAATQAADEEEEAVLRKLTDRQKDERLACPETLPAQARLRQKDEAAADMTAVELLGQQCQIGADGKRRHSIYLLGTQWYFMAAMADKLLLMGRASNSPVIARALRLQLGDALYEQVVAARAETIQKGAVARAYPLTHPPDANRIHAIEMGLAATPCGASGIDTSDAQLLEQVRAMMCRGLIRQQQ